MVALEEAGGFVSAATAEQVRVARQTMAAQVTSLLAGKADMVLAAGVAARAGEILRVLRATGAPGLAQIEQRILSGMEETLGRRGQELSDQLASTIVPGNVAAVGPANVRQAQLGVTFYNEHVGPALAALESACDGAEHHERRLRARGMAGVTMGNLGQAWLYAGDFAAADEALTSAVQLGSGTWAEANLRQELEENAPRAALQRQGVSPKKVAKRFPMRPRRIVQPHGGVTVRAPENRTLWIILAVLLWLGIQGAQWYWLRPARPPRMPLPPRVVIPPPPRVPAYPTPGTPSTP
jgi:hypothetical protein